MVVFFPVPSTQSPVPNPQSQFCAIQRQLWQYGKKLKNLETSKDVFPCQAELSTRRSGLFCALSLQIGKLKSPKQMVMFINQPLLSESTLRGFCCTIPLHYH
ncbi:hypothetical protein HUN01_28085 [Nostoc edaphicum CCNP1411]|uniref:Uncharacterized protein n=1 Tax=Nostoc edaphicum CCNP1411 TaxID=1472755 RepID=A0A7D7R813_9NOSO|nr:hypothetical protein [Nostoc edaphicum]QMS91266.1 hypothetical protein HUN01_28085 [Nostoc edaphicum CCNP1411]